MAERPTGFGLTAEINAKVARFFTFLQNFITLFITMIFSVQIASKFDETKAQEAINWIEEIIGEPTGSDGGSQEGFQEGLKDGIKLLKSVCCCDLHNKLCYTLYSLMNIIRGNAGKTAYKINTSKMAFKQMENIGNFLTGCEEFGMVKTDLFQTVSLYEGTNIPQVVDTIHALGRKVS